jgi:uncharacterized protein (TIGR02145 family)
MMIRNSKRVYCLLLMVAALCLCTQLSPASLQMINFGNAPSAPVISVIAGAGSVTVSWNVVTGADSYKLFYQVGTTIDTAQAWKFTGVTSPKQVTGLINGTTYAFVVSSVNAVGESGLSSILTATPQAAPGVPSAPTISSATLGDSRVTVTWDTVSSATSYNLYYQQGTSVIKGTATEITGVTSPRIVSSLTNGIQYAFAVCAVNVGGESELSNLVTATPSATPVAPSITTQPKSQTVTAGQSVTFSVVVSGTAPLTYQWKMNGSIITGATADSLNIPNVQNSSAGAYTVVVSNTSGSAVSDAATLTVTAAPVAPSIATQPKSQTVMVGSNVTFAVSATGTGPFTYKWEKNGDTITHSDSSSYTIANVANADAGTYSVVVKNSVGSVTSLDAVLTVTATPVAPTITTQPQSQTVTAGQTVTFTVAATGTGQLSYQWQKGNSVISGATASSYSITNVQNANTGAYSVKVTNSVGNVLSDSAVLTVTASAVAPSITTQPQSQTLTAGQNVTFSVAVSGTAPFTYQWKKDTVSISGATSNSLYLSNVQAANAGTYTVVVSNSAGNAVSNGAVLTVNAAPTIPSITTQPRSDTVTVGQSVTFSVVAMGTMPLSYQWKKNGTSIAGDTASSFTISTVAMTDGGSYTVTVANSGGNVVSNGAVLTVNPASVAPSITTQPKSQTVTAGQSDTFSVTATGTAPLTYQWYKNDTAISGATSSSYSISNAQAGNAGTYTVTVSNGTLPNAKSNGAVLTVIPAPVAPSITTQPKSQTVTIGQSVTFSVVATGTAPLSYQWNISGSPISGATSASYSISNVQAANAGTYSVTVSNGISPYATSSGAVLTVNPVPVAPSITVQPKSDTVFTGQSVTFTVTATGTAPLTYQWYIGGTAILGATSTSYLITNVRAANAGTYTVTISNGTLPNATSSGAVLIVNPASGTVSDIDGNVYQTIAIGTQVWMVENLKTTRYNDGTAIPLVTGDSAWRNLKTPGYCWYNDSAIYSNTYGALYNWYAVKTGKLAPTGWHVPSDSEWTVLVTYLGGETVAGAALKDTGTTYWLSPNTGATNSTGFSALAAGYRSNGNGLFNLAGNTGYWWSSTAHDTTSSWIRYMYYLNASVEPLFYNFDCGYSVRCVKNP